MRVNRLCLNLLPVIAALIVASSSVLYFYVPRFIRNEISKTLPIVNTSESRTFINWQQIPFQIRNNLYLFNVTNTDAVRNGKKPILQQLGPFVFYEKRVKRNLKWQPAPNFIDKSSTVEYEEYRNWQFVPELSNGSLSDKIQHLNVPLVSAGNSIYSSLEYFGLNMAVKLTGSELFQTHTAGELLFDGYADSFLKLAEKFRVQIPFDRFGWFYGKNNSANGVYQIFTGTSRLKDIGKLISWRNQTKLNIWNGKCNSLNEVITGDLFPPFQNPAPKFVKIFVAEICRPLKLYYTGTQVIHGVSANRFMVTESSLDYAIEENQCFCPNYPECPPNGLINVGPCLKNAPIGVSLPNFLFADSVYRNKIISIEKPEVNKHSFYVDIEPTLGIPVRISVRMQINVHVKRNEYLDFARDLNQSAYYPQIWFDVSASINEDMAKQIRLLQSITFYINIFVCGLIITAIILLSIRLYVVILVPNRAKQNYILYDPVPITWTSKANINVNSTVI